MPPALTTTPSEQRKEVLVRDMLIFYRGIRLAERIVNAHSLEGKNMQDCQRALMSLRITAKFPKLAIKALTEIDKPEFPQYLVTINEPTELSKLTLLAETDEAAWQILRSYVKHMWKDVLPTVDACANEDENVRLFFEDLASEYSYSIIELNTVKEVNSFLTQPWSAFSKQAVEVPDA